MRSRSPAGSSTPTSRLTRHLSFPRFVVLAALLIPVVGFYVIEAFTAPSPVLRIVLRSAPVLPVAIWTLWFDRSRPFERRPPGIRLSWRFALLVLVMAFAVTILGFGLNWLYDPSRVI
jgi:drug/metabolite transporter (DMT)-like permease